MNKIKWVLGDLQEELRFDWGLYVVWGEDKKGNEFAGSIQTFIHDPVIKDVYDIEKV